jgi:predicted DNA binding CopG/RHH family protein
MVRALKARAKARGVRYQRFVREILNTRYMAVHRAGLHAMHFAS